MNQKEKQEQIKRILEDIETNMEQYKQFVMDCVKQTINQWTNEELTSWTNPE